MDNPDRIISAITESLNGDSHKNWLYKADRLLIRYLGDRETAYKAEDIVSEIILKTIDEGGRNWDMDKVPLDAYMMKTIESVVWNIIRKDRYTEKMNFNNYKDNPSAAEIINRHSRNQDNTGLERDFREMYECCLDILAGDEECLKLFKEMRKGASEEQLEKLCGMDRRKILTVKQRIRRKLKKKIFYNNT